MNIRQMSNNDLEFVLNLTALEGWNSTRVDFEELLRYDPHGCFIGEIDGEPVGMVCTVCYGDFGFIGNLIVRNMYRGQHFGKTLMEYGMEYLQERGTKSILLDGVPKAVSLYEKLGFRKIAKSLRVEAVLSGRDTTLTRLMTKDDISKISTFDERYFGGLRIDFLRMRFVAYPEFCRVIELDGKIYGFIMGSRSGDYIRIGPWVMKGDDQLAEHLLIEFAGEQERNLLKIGVLESNVQALKVLRKYNFKETSHSWRMLYRKDTEATLSDHLYAICCPARG